MKIKKSKTKTLETKTCRFIKIQKKKKRTKKINIDHVFTIEPGDKY